MPLLCSKRGAGASLERLGARQTFDRDSVPVLGLHKYAQTLGIFDVAVQIVELLAIDLDFGEKNVPFMSLLFALLRFEANLFLLLGGS
jgi:hypothetical protein